MIYKFKDIRSKEWKETGRVIFVTGKYDIFNNYVCDSIRDLYKTKESNTKGAYSDWGIEDNTEESINNKVDISDFFNVVNTPSIHGKWQCIVDFDSIGNKEIDKISNYIKNPNKNGILVITIKDFKNYVKYLNNTLIKNSNNIHLIQLSFPTKEGLYNIAKDLFTKHNMKVTETGIQYFIMRMSKSYNEYEKVIEDIRNKTSKELIKIEDLKISLKGIDNYVIEDFIEELIKPVNTKDIKGNRKIYKILGSLLEEFESRRLVGIIKSKIKECIEMRKAINEGYVPVNVKYSLNTVRSLLGENELVKLSDYRFRRIAELASKTSLKDWLYIYLMLNNINKYLEEDYERVLYAIIHRKAYEENTVKKLIGII